MSQKKESKMNTETAQIDKETQGLGFEEFIDNMAQSHRALNCSYRKLAHRVFLRFRYTNGIS